MQSMGIGIVIYQGCCPEEKQLVLYKVHLILFYNQTMTNNRRKKIYSKWFQSYLTTRKGITKITFFKYLFKDMLQRKDQE